MKFLIVISAVLLLTYETALADEHTRTLVEQLQLKCDYKKPDFEDCQAKYFKEECDKRPNEQYLRCIEEEPTCAIPNPEIVSLTCMPGCVCKDGYYRNEQKQCVPKNEC